MGVRGLSHLHAPVRTPMSQYIVTTWLICRQSSACCQTNPGVDSARLLKPPCGIWHRDLSGRSFKSCNPGMDWNRRSGTSRRRSTGLRRGEFRGQGNTLNPSWYSSNRSRTMWARYLTERGHCRGGMPSPWRGVPGAQWYLAWCPS